MVVCGVTFLLGIAEAVNFPGGVKVISEWFPPTERSTAVGLFSSGAAIGAIIAPPCVIFLTVQLGWRFAFVWIGIPSLLWVFFWLRNYPRQAEQRQGVAENLNASEMSRPVGRRWSWSFLIKCKAIIGVSCARALEEPVAWFYFSWLAVYLNDVRHTPLNQIGSLLIFPFITLDIGYLTGGWVASRLMKVGWSVNRARKVVMAVSVCCMTSSILALSATTTVMFICLISIATFGHGSWGANVFALPADLVASEHVGTVYGFTALAGGIGSVLFVQLVGALVDVHHSFTFAFILVGLLPLAALIPILMITIQQTEKPVTEIQL